MDQGPYQEVSHFASAEWLFVLVTKQGCFHKIKSPLGEGRFNQHIVLVSK